MNCIAKLVASSLFIFFFSFCTKSSSGGTETPPATAPATADTSAYRLVWSDEFDSTAINTQVWNFETGGNGWGNHEQEYYTANNAAIENGNLVITAKKQTVGSNNYTSSRMTTKDKRDFTFGKIEARIKMPVGQGLWPAFWMLGSNISSVDWPTCGETDIMEHINADSIIHGTLHWNSNGAVQSTGDTSSTPSNYHVYGVEWTSSFINFYVDDIVYHSINISASAFDAFRKPSFLLFNMAVGGDWPGQTIDNSLFPAKMYVDWVRVYQKQ